MKSVNVLAVILTAFCLLMPAAGLANDLPQLINIQGVLTNLDGDPVADASYSVVFTIYNDAGGGSTLWTETRVVTTKGGLFAIIL